MNFQSHLENLRAKPEHIRRRIAFLASFGFTAIIFTFWVASFTSIGTSASQEVASAVGNVGSPGQSLIAGVGGFFGDIRDLVFTPKKVEYKSVEVRPGK